MSAITPIQNIPNPNTQSPNEFDEKTTLFLNHDLPTFITELNNFADTLNGEIGINDNVTNTSSTWSSQKIVDYVGSASVSYASTAGDSDKLDGHDSSYFATANHNHDGVYAAVNHNHDTVYTKQTSKQVLNNGTALSVNGSNLTLLKGDGTSDIISLDDINNIIVSSIAPTNTSKIWFDTNENVFKKYISENWTTVSGSSGSPTASILDIFGDGSCIALFEFEGNANDTGGVYNGTWNGTEAYGVGKFGQAAIFDGNSQVDICQYNLIKALSLWMFVSSGANFVNICSYDCTTVGTVLSIRLIQGGSLYTLSGDGVSWIERKTSNSLIADSWNHIVVSLDASNNIDIYINNTYEGNFDSTDNISSAIATIGRSFNGLIDQVRIFNRALTDTEVQTLYNEGVN